MSSALRVELVPVSPVLCAAMARAEAKALAELEALGLPAEAARQLLDAEQRALERRFLYGEGAA